MIRICFAIAILALVPAQSFATIIDGQILRQNGQGQFIKLPADSSFAVGADNFNTDHLYGFDEDQNIVLPEDIQVDVGGADGMIAQGTEVASHYVFFDSVSGVQYGYVYFDAPIIGIAAFRETMGATDFLANTSVTYISTDLRGLERGDHVWIDEDDPHRLWVYWAGSSPGDYIRVFTERSPTAAMM